MSDRVVNEKALRAVYRQMKEDLDYTEKRALEDTSLQNWWSSVEGDVFVHF